MIAELNAGRQRGIYERIALSPVENSNINGKKYLTYFDGPDGKFIHLESAAGNSSVFDLPVKNPEKYFRKIQRSLSNAASNSFLRQVFRFGKTQATRMFELTAQLKSINDQLVIELESALNSDKDWQFDSYIKKMPKLV